MADKMVYFFGGEGKADGNGTLRELLGGKGANLAEMANIGLPVPAGVTITTEVCTTYYDNDKQYPDGLVAEVEEGLGKIEAAMGAKFGCSENPLLLSCRSGARESMPGMMDTVLNIGLNDTTVEALAKAAGNEAFAYDSFRRFIQMYGDVVKEVSRHKFEDLLEKAKEAAGVEFDKDLTADNLKQLVADYKALYKSETGEDFPTDPKEQVWGCIGAVFDSWMNDRAIVYRRQYGIPHEWGTAVNVQAMVFGNLGEDCATGVGLTRDCSIGTPGFTGDWLRNAQGEDVVAGIRTPQSISEDLPKEMPEAYKQLDEIGKTLEKHYKDVQDIEFTVQKGKVWMLQTRNAKRTGFAAVRIAVDMVEEGLITPKEALAKKPDRLGRVPGDPVPPRRLIRSQGPDGAGRRS